MPAFEQVFPSIRGIQAGREYYVSMVPLRLLPRMFKFNDDEMRPELRAQRFLNRARLPEMARYIADNKDDYVFSAITASIDGNIRFNAIGEESSTYAFGSLHVPMEARIIINDGQHRQAAITMALESAPEIGDETIAVVFFLDQGLERCQQMFADLNRYAVRPSRSLGVLYDHRDDKAELVRLVVSKSPFFSDVVDLEKTALSPRSRKLFTLSALYNATGALLQNCDSSNPDERAERALQYWIEVAEQLAEWRAVHEGRMTAGEVRQDYIHSHGVVLHALGRAGSCLLKRVPKNWRARIAKLNAVDWRRSNDELWEGRAMVGGRVSKSQRHVALTTNAIKLILTLPLSDEEQALENEFAGREDVAA